MGNEETAVNKSSYDMDFNVSRETRAQLDVLCARFNIPSTITMRAITRGELPSNTMEDKNEIPILAVVLECGVRLPLAPFVKQFQSVLPLHSLHTSLVLWKNLLALCVMWHKAYGQDLSMAKL